MNYDVVVGASAHGWSDSEEDTPIPRILSKLNVTWESELLDNLDPSLLKNQRELVEAYIQTLYWVEDADFPVRVGKYSLEAHKVAAKINKNRASEKGLLLLSAHNPRGRIKEGIWNADQQSKLAELMSEKGLLLGHGKGISLVPDKNFLLHWEAFCMIGPITENDALQLCREYAQIACVFTGRNRPAKLIFSGLMPE